jgi:hypothetical protein
MHYATNTQGTQLLAKMSSVPNAKEKQGRLKQRSTQSKFPRRVRYLCSRELAATARRRIANLLAAALPDHR